MKKISVVTGTRAEYGLLRPLLKGIVNNPHFELDLIVTGMHLISIFGHTIDEIKKDGFEINAEIPSDTEHETPNSMALSVGKTIIGVSNYLLSSVPDILLVLGDRTETLGAAIAGAYLNIPVAHLSGGDISWGGLDESARHAITKFSHIHFPSTLKSAERLRKLGEDEWRIFPVGLIGIDEIMQMRFPSKRYIEEKYDLQSERPFILLVQHPVSTESDKSEQQIIETLEAIKTLKIQTIAIYPNSDLGGRNMISQIKKYQTYSYFQAYPSLPRHEYLTLLKYASVLVGNSSSGMTESGSFHTPVVNIGIRQMSRERGDNVIDVPHNKQKIIDAIKIALDNQEFKKRVKNTVNPYGEGKTVDSILKILSETNFSGKWIKKMITY